ncbi:MarR family transcriptional regulator [Brevibacterium sp.]|uniref:MarR family winged helix-turn-helix transcriptional regulator n=1 Tax=Brevibacterium sp. TaxID=1701 RepID=UPI0025C59417|nr:MarR family transcriptional regulator [Brevibacterium sp.]
MKQHGGKDRYRDEAAGGEAHGGEHLHDGGGVRDGHATVPDGTAPVESLIGYLLKQTQTALRARMDEALRPLELTTPQYSCLEALNSRPGASTSEIARAVFVTRQTMNTLLRGLQERGLVERIPHSSGGRALPLRLTEEGTRLLARASAEARAVERTMTNALRPAQREALEAALRACTEALSRRADPPGADR